MPVWLVAAVAVVVAAIVLDCLALWAEKRGWIYYRRTNRHTGATLGDAFLEVQELVQR